MNKVESTKTLKFKYQNGVTSTGKEKYAYNTISGVPNNVTDEIVFGLLPLFKKVQKEESSQVQVSQTAVLQ